MIVVCLESPDSSSIFSLELAEFNIVHISMQTMQSRGELGEYEEN